ncbi:glycosyltransferase family 2 protein [Tatumella morbirosei]|uniref:glycosyltransferase family 2 protein n=1 Tax=Tatumella morbirosei TaxID=642227 RepID=UPI00069B0BEE|nr:glycosyltransferase family 2 protein [Tatumella morbirosei]
MSLPDVTAIITTYNSEGYIEETLRNITSQTLSNIQIIFVDDASSDLTTQIIQKYCEHDDRYTLLVNESNYGAGYSRNRGLDYAKGEYIIFLDDDDLYNENILSESYHRAIENNADIVVFRSDIIDDQNGNISSAEWTIAHDMLPKEKTFNASQVTGNFFRSFIWWAWDKLIRRELILTSGLKFQGIRTTNDLYFVCAIMLQARSITILDEVLISHRENRTGSLSNTRELSYHCSLEAVEKLNDFIISKPDFKRLQLDYINYSVEFLGWSLSTLKNWQSYKHFFSMIQSFYQALPVVNYNDFESEYLAETYQGFYSATAEDMLMILKCRLENDIRHLTQINDDGNKKLISLGNNIEKLSIVNDEYTNQLHQLEGQKNEMTHALQQQIEQKSELERKLQSALKENEHLLIVTKQYQEAIAASQRTFCAKIIGFFVRNGNKTR